jgi:signal peptidase I
LLLWVNDRVVEFDGPTTYMPGPNVKPVWSENDPGDLEPVGIGARGVELAVSRLRLYRDVYYVATSYKTAEDYRWVDDNDYVDSYNESYDESDILKVLTTPELWSTTRLFDARRQDKAVQFEMDEDQFFPLGDNSPQSRDARLWSQVNHLGAEPYVDRKLLTGKALVIYWPHSWRRPIPFLPNIKRMGLIR